MRIIRSNNEEGNGQIGCIYIGIYLYKYISIQTYLYYMNFDSSLIICGCSFRLAAMRCVGDGRMAEHNFRYIRIPRISMYTCKQSLVNKANKVHRSKDFRARIHILVQCSAHTDIRQATMQRIRFVVLMLTSMLI